MEISILELLSKPFAGNSTNLIRLIKVFFLDGQVFMGFKVVQKNISRQVNLDESILFPK
jgi:hypothetical protein